MKNENNWQVYSAEILPNTDRYNQVAFNTECKKYILSLNAPLCVAEDFATDEGLTYLADFLEKDSLDLLVQILDNEGYACKKKTDFSDYIPNRYDRFYTDSVDEEYIDYLEIDNVNSTYSIELSRTTEILDMTDKHGFLIGGIYVSCMCFKALVNGIKELYREVRKNELWR